VSPEADLDRALAGITSRRMLDVATGSGRMARYVLDRLAGHGEVIGIDRDETVEPDFRATFEAEPEVRFVAMDALDLSFPAGSFDVVTMSHALCAFDDDDRDRLLRSLVDVLTADGVLIVSETYRDQAAEPERTHVLLHDWWGEVDAHEGILHRPFQTRAELRARMEALPFRSLRYSEVAEEPSDPLARSTLEWIDGVNDAALARAAGQPALLERGAELRDRMHRVGFRIARAQVALGSGARDTG
jgi:SAM-dependent methyltransferase